MQKQVARFLVCKVSRLRDLEFTVFKVTQIKLNLPYVIYVEQAILQQPIWLYEKRFSELNPLSVYTLQHFFGSWSMPAM